MAAEDCCGTCRYFSVLTTQGSALDIDEEFPVSTGVCTVDDQQLVMTSDEWCGDYE
jgi:hypothetical protein